MLMGTPPRWVRPKRQLPPGFIVPCQPILASKVPAGDGWLHELKHDGYRIIAYKDGERVRLWSRNGRDWSIRRHHRRRARPPLQARHD
jgi:ATP-dependent DNA ligase